MGKYSSDSSSSDSERDRKSHKRSKHSRRRSRSRSSSRHKSDYPSSSRHRSDKSSRNDKYSSSSKSSSSRYSEKRSQRSSSRSSEELRSSKKKSSSSSTVKDLPINNDELMTSAEQLRLKVQKAIQAAAALKSRKTEEPVAAPSQSSIAEIESAGFVQRAFTSVPKIQIPDAPPIVVDITESRKEDTEFVSYVLIDGEEARVERWARKLHALRQQARKRIFGDTMAVQ